MALRMRVALEERKGRKVTRVVYGNGTGRTENARDMAGDESARFGQR